MAFWVVALLVAGLAAASLALALVRRRAVLSADEADIALYRDQLAEIEVDRARGVLPSDEADRVRAEVARRLLAADQRHRETVGKTSGDLPAWAAWVLMVLVVGASGGLYMAFGAPGYHDQPIQARIAAAENARQQRPDQASVEAMFGERPVPEDVPDDLVDLAERLRAAVANRPDDVEGLMMLARIEAQLGQFVAAHEAMAQVIEVKGDAATIQDREALADLMIAAVGGYISPEAEAVLDTILQEDPENGMAGYYFGLMHAQNGRPDIAFDVWRQVLQRGPSNAPWIQPIIEQIETVALAAGIAYDAPLSELRGPTASDIEAAANLDASDRMAMIESMVSGLSDRLATEGGPVEEWAQLIRALGVLGRQDEARTILQEALDVFGDDAAARQLLNAAGREAGIGQ